MLTVALCNQKKKTDTSAGATAVANPASEDFDMTPNATYNCEVFTMPGPREHQPTEDFEMTQNATYNCEMFTLPESRPAETNGDIHGTNEEGYVINQLVYEAILPVPEKEADNIYEPISPLFGSGEDTLSPFAYLNLTSELALGTDDAEPTKEKETGKACDARKPLTDAAVADDPAREAYYVINQLNYENPPKKSTTQ